MQRTENTFEKNFDCNLTQQALSKIELGTKRK